VCESDPWELAVTPDRFAEQLAFLRDTREFFAMRTFLDLLETGRLPANGAAVTFDDGYVDNLKVAKPLLQRAGVPAAVFIATGYVGKGREFWWDELARLILQCAAAVDCAISIAGTCHRFELSTALASDVPETPWKDWRRPRTEREHAFIGMWKLLQPLAGAERETALLTLQSLLGSAAADPDDLPMTVEEIDQLTGDGLIEIGAHTETHPILTGLHRNARMEEIVSSKIRCEQLLGRPVQGFAYPHGEFDDETRADVREAGFRFACSTRARSIDAGCFDALALPRLKVKNWDASRLEQELLAVKGEQRKPKRAAKSGP
jgi:peptidoglycan/xylan/chitin deacetylase (PgdA/CDA1 family)